MTMNNSMLQRDYTKNEIEILSIDCKNSELLNLLYLICTICQELSNEILHIARNQLKAFCKEKSFFVANCLDLFCLTLKIYRVLFYNNI